MMEGGGTVGAEQGKGVFAVFQYAGGRKALTMCRRGVCMNREAGVREKRRDQLCVIAHCVLLVQS